MVPKLTGGFEVHLTGGQTMQEKDRENIALFRYGLIAPFFSALRN
jgi:hypothetical protein